MSVSPKAGKDFLLKMGDGAGTEVFTTIGGLRSSSLSISGETVDGSNVGSGGFKELIAAAGQSSVSLSGSGVFTNSASELLAIEACLAKTIHNFQIIDGAGNTYAGAFQITSCEQSADYNAEQTYSLSMESSGAVTFTAAP